MSKERKSLTDLANETPVASTTSPATPRMPSFTGAHFMGRGQQPQAVARREVILEVDPKRCRGWKYHNRHASWYTKERCADLIESLKVESQKLPGLVRALSGDPDFDYEVIYGMRRRFACDAIGIKFKVAVTQADDQECAKLQHIENADKRDISPMERAQSFRDHIKSKLFSTQEELAKAFNLKPSLLSQQLSAAEIFDFANVARLFPTPQDIPMKGAYQLSQHLRNDQTKGLVLKTAESLVKSNAQETKTAQAIIKLLVSAPVPASRVRKLDQRYNLGAKASVVVNRNERGKVTLKLPKGIGDSTKDGFVELLGKIYDDLVK